MENFDIKQESFYIQNLTGHFDNPITLASTNLKKEGAKAFVIKFFENDNYKKYGSNALKFSENFTWNKIVKKYLDLI